LSCPLDIDGVTTAGLDFCAYATNDLPEEDVVFRCVGHTVTINDPMVNRRGSDLFQVMFILKKPFIHFPDYAVASAKAKV